MNGRPIAVVPQRSLLIVAGDGDDAAIKRLAQIEYDASKTPISPAVYTVDDSGKVVPLVLARDHHLHGDVRRGHVILAMDQYAEQELRLHQMREKAGTDLFVARYEVLTHDVLGVIGYTIWAEEVLSLLPVADVVFIVGGGNENDDPKDRYRFMVRWEDLMRIAGEWLRRVPDIYPTRFETLTWPDRKTLDRLWQARVS